MIQVQMSPQCPTGTHLEHLNTVFSVALDFLCVTPLSLYTR